MRRWIAFLVVALAIGSCRARVEARALDGGALAAPAPPPAASPLPSSVRSPGGAWYGVYMRGQKVGFARMQHRPGKRGGEATQEVSSMMEIRANFGRMRVDMRDETTRVYEAGGEERLLSIRKHQVQANVETHVEVDRAGEKMIATRKIAGREERRELPAAKERFADSLFGKSRRDAKPGQVLQGHQFFEELLSEFAVTTKILSVREERFGGVRLPLVQVSIEGLPLGLKMGGRFTLDGDLVSGEIGPVTLRLEGEAAARAPHARTDLLDVAANRIPRLAERDAPVLRLRVRGLAPALARPTPHQTFERLGEGEYRITLRGVRAPAKPAPLGAVPAELQVELRPTPALQVDHPEVRALAQGAVGGETDAFRAALKLRDAVHRRLKPTWQRTLDALSALRAGGGMCFEYAHVLAAAARAAGIPARLAYGIVYVEVPDGARFVGHAWTELWVGEWLIFDATEKVGPARGPHVKLGDDESVGQALGAMGGLQMEWEK